MEKTFSDILLEKAIDKQFMKPIPIKAAKAIAKEYGYDQVVIVARKTGSEGREHVTTYGVNKEHCSIAGKIGNKFKKMLRWPDGL